MPPTSAPSIASSPSNIPSETNERPPQEHGERNMQRHFIKGLILAALASISVTALANPTDTDYFAIRLLEGSSGSDDAFRVYPEAPYTLPLLGCKKRDFAEVSQVGLTTGVKSLMAKSLMAAFSANRK